VFSLPDLPDFHALHPLVIHFPIALLLVAPVFIVLAALWFRHQTAFAISALLLMLMGTAGAWISAATGNAAEGVVTKTDEIRPVLEQHQRLGLMTRNLFTLLTLIYGVALAAPALFKWSVPNKLSLAWQAAFLAAYLAAALILANAGHLGGRLVHEFEVLALFL